MAKVEFGNKDDLDPSIDIKIMFAAVLLDIESDMAFCKDHIDVRLDSCNQRPFNGSDFNTTAQGNLGIKGCRNRQC